MSDSKLLTSDRPLIVLPQLAKGLRQILKAYASDGAAFLQQIHYWCTTTSGVVDSSGRRWIYNSYQQWLNQFPWLTDYAFRKIKFALLEIGIIETAALGQCDRTLYYSVNYSHPLLKDFFVPISTDGRNSISTNPSVDCSTDIDTKTTPKTTFLTTTEHSLPVAAQEKKEPSKEEQDLAICQIAELTTAVQLNLQVRKAIAQYWVNFPTALERLKIAVQENWRCNLTGVLVKALKEGVPSEEAALPCTFYGWGEWANEATKRRLMEYSYSHEGDIMVHFVGGASRLWSEVRGLSWSKIESQLHQQITEIRAKPTSFKRGM